MGYYKAKHEDDNKMEGLLCKKKVDGLGLTDLKNILIILM